jgi:hypothetical protein
LYYNNYLEKLLRYKLEEKKAFCCEVCGVKKITERRATAAITVNELKMYYQNTLYLFKPHCRSLQ